MGLLPLVFAAGIVVVLLIRTRPHQGWIAQLRQWGCALRRLKPRQTIADVRTEAHQLADPIRQPDDVGVAGIFDLAESGEAYYDPQALIDTVTGGRLNR